jgi:hypothetical protein
LEVQTPRRAATSRANSIGRKLNVLLHRLWVTGEVYRPRAVRDEWRVIGSYPK